MDDRRFDDVARRLGTSASRRARRRCYRRCGQRPTTGGTLQLGAVCVTSEQCTSDNCAQVAVGERRCQACPENRQCAGGCCGVGLVCLPALGLCV